MRYGTGTNRGEEFLLPVLPTTRYLVEVENVGLELRFPSDEITNLSIRAINPLDAPLLVTQRKSDQDIRIVFPDGSEMIPLLRSEGEAGKRFVKDLHVLARYGLHLNSVEFRALSPLFAVSERLPNTPWQADVDAPKTPSLAIAIHLYYRDLWDEFEACLRHHRRPFHLFVTLNEDDTQLVQHISAVFPDSDVSVVENRGRDVAPFFHLVNSGRLDGYDLICKLHGKKTTHDGRRTVLGEIWRKANIAELIGSPDKIDQILALFGQNPRIGMIGASQFRLPKETYPAAECWETDKEECARLAAKLDIAPSGIDFYAGTMFWMRRELLEPLRRLHLNTSDFPPEPSANGGQIHHALERFFGVLPTGIGLSLCDSPKSTVHERQFACEHKAPLAASM